METTIGHIKKHSINSSVVNQFDFIFTLFAFLGMKVVEGATVSHHNQAKTYCQSYYLRKATNKREKLLPIMETTIRHIKKHPINSSVVNQFDFIFTLFAFQGIKVVEGATVSHQNQAKTYYQSYYLRKLTT